MSLATRLIDRRRRDQVIRQAVEPRWSAMEGLELRRLLSVAPTANDDAYAIPPDGHLSVDVIHTLVPIGPAPAEVVPAKPGETDLIIDVIGTERSETGPVQIGVHGKYGEINVKEGGKYSITGDVMHGQGWTELGAHGGYGKLTISGGGKMSSANWTEAGYYGGFAEVLLTGEGSQWKTAQFVAMGDHVGSGAIFTVSDGAHFDNGNWFEAGYNGGWARVLLTGEGTRWDNSQFFTIGDNGGRGRMMVSHGATLNTKNWTEIGNGTGSRGRIVVTGAGTTWANANWMEIGGDGGQGTVAIMDGASLTTSWMQIGHGGRLVGDGSIRLVDNMHMVGAPQYIENHGLINPGASTGVLKIDGSRLEQMAAGRLQFDVRGAARGSEYDGIDLTGQLVAGGELLVRFTHGYAAKEGDSYDLVRAGSITGDFANVRITGLSAPGDLEYRIERVQEGGQTVLRLVILKDTMTHSALVDFDPVLGRGVLRNDVDPDLDPLYDKLSLILLEKPKHGTLFLDEGGGFTYQAGPSYDGEDSFRYLADDGVLTSEPATVRITGEVERPEPPATQPDAYTATEDTALVVSKEQGVLANDTGATVAQLVAGPQHGGLRLAHDGSFWYRPNFNFVGTDTFTYRAGNAEGVFSDPVTVTIKVEHGNDAPTARPDSKTTKQNTPLVFDAADLLANDTDPDGDHLTVTGVSGVRITEGTVKLEDGKITYTPPANYAGTDAFYYDVSDGRGGTARSYVKVAVLRDDQPQMVGRATGHGSLNDHKQFFFFNVQSTRVGDALSARGHLAFFDTTKQLSFVSTAIDTFSMPQNIHGSTAIFAGRGMLNGNEGYRFEVTVQDFGGSGGLRDTFSIRIISNEVTPIPEGVTVYQLTGTLDEFGNIAVRHAPPQRGAGGMSIVRGLDGRAVRRR